MWSPTCKDGYDDDDDVDADVDGTWAAFLRQGMLQLAQRDNAAFAALMCELNRVWGDGMVSASSAMPMAVGRGAQDRSSSSSSSSASMDPFLAVEPLTEEDMRAFADDFPNV